MKVKTTLSLLIAVMPLIVSAQITTPVIKANFGVDADLRSNYFNGFLQPGNDDWFFHGGFGSGQFVIDTTGAAAVLARYAVDPDFRKLPFFRPMRFPPFSVINNRLLIDAVYIRDYHGDDSTMFAAGSNKNGMSPADWSAPQSQSVPDKNEILDMYVHVRRAGPTSSDSLWMFGGLSIENTTGDRYFDFEMYQTDIFFGRPTLSFYGYGPDAGHTSWQFDSAGNVTRAGDIIFTAEYSTAALTSVEARIWVNESALSLTPATFDWGGDYDGANAGATFGYASIHPKTAGAFYTGLASPDNTWAGPFKLVLGDNSVVPNYTLRQFMEFSVNLTKLGLDPIQLLGGDNCQMPFRRILVKSRASTSFTAELKDFVGPFDFFLPPRAQAAADIPVFCGTEGVSQLTVTNPTSTSVYTWSTPDGHISGSDTGTTITVDTAGTYIVRQQLQAGCSTYAMDTVYVVADSSCVLLAQSLENFRGILNKGVANISWELLNKHDLSSFELQRSIDGLHFETVANIPVNEGGDIFYKYRDVINGIAAPFVFYRLKLKTVTGAEVQGMVIKLANILSAGEVSWKISPNPVTSSMELSIISGSNQNLWVRIIDVAGRIMKTVHANAKPGLNTIGFSGMEAWSRGIYQVQLLSDSRLVGAEKVVLIRY